MNTHRTAALAFACLALTSWANAVTFNLHSSSATVVNGDVTSLFYDVKGDGSETNGTTAKDWFTSTRGGNANTGFWVNMAFGTNPQPVLESAYLKASNKYLRWDANDLIAFNAGLYDSITLWNDGANGLKNQNNRFFGTSHAGLYGTAGVRIPDGGTTAGLLGLALIALGTAARRLSHC